MSVGGLDLRKLVAVLITLAVAAPICYLAFMYGSLTSARFSVSGIGLTETPNPIEALLSRQLDIDMYLDIEGHGVIPIPVKTLEGQIYLEDVYMGSVSSSEPFTIPTSGTSTAHLTFHLNLATISLEDIQQVVSSISAHNGEVKIGFDGYIEPIVLFFPVTIPISHSVYALPVSDAPQVTSLQWDSTSCYMGDSAVLKVAVRNPFRGSSIEGVLDVIVREDVALGFDVNARVYHFAVNLAPGQSHTFSDAFVPYKESSTRGFFLKTMWGPGILAEQSNMYPPRLAVIEGALSLVSVYWTVDGQVVESADLGDEVTAHVTVCASRAGVDDLLTIRIRKDIAAWPDDDFKVASFVVSLEKDEPREYIVRFTPDEPSEGSLRGYFVELEDAVSWTMQSAYPPRLAVTSGPVGGTPSVIDSWWTTVSRRVNEVLKGQTVQAHIRVKAVGGEIDGSATIRIREDIPHAFDEDHKVQTHQISLNADQATELVMTFTASESTSSSFRGYFIQVDFSPSGFSWTMDSSYPPRLAVREEGTEEGMPLLQDVWWTANDEVVIDAQQGQTVRANVRIKADGGAVQGQITIRIRKDIALWPDEDHKVHSFAVSLLKDQVIDLVVTFAAEEKSGGSFRGYFAQVDFDSWGTTWTMESSYPPRLEVT